MNTTAFVSHSSRRGDAPLGTHMTLKEFNRYVAKLNDHDWTYSFKNDIRVWRRGRDSEDALLTEAGKHEILQQAYDAWYSSVFVSTKEAAELGYAGRVTKREQTLDKLRLQIRTATATATATKGA